MNNVTLGMAIAEKGFFKTFLEKDPLRFYELFGSYEQETADNMDYIFFDTFGERILTNRLKSIFIHDSPIDCVNRIVLLSETYFFNTWLRVKKSIESVLQEENIQYPIKEKRTYSETKEIERSNNHNSEDKNMVFAFDENTTPSEKNTDIRTDSDINTGIEKMNSSDETLKGNGKTLAENEMVNIDFSKHVNFIMSIFQDIVSICTLSIFN